MSGYTHELKTWPMYFRPLMSGEKAFEFRADDRTPRFEVGDRLRLREWGGATMDYSGRDCWREVTYVARGGVIPEGFCVMSVVPVRVPTPDGETPHPEYGSCDNLGPRGGCSECAGALEWHGGEYPPAMVIALGKTWGDRQMQRNMPSYALASWMSKTIEQLRSDLATARAETLEAQRDAERWRYVRTILRADYWLGSPASTLVAHTFKVPSIEGRANATVEEIVDAAIARAASPEPIRPAGEKASEKEWMQGVIERTQAKIEAKLARRPPGEDA